MDGSRTVPGAQAPRGLFHRPVAALTADWSARIGERLAGVGGLEDRDRQVIARDARQYLLAGTETRLGRTLLLELRAASLTGQLDAPDPRERWNAFLDHARGPAFRDGLDARYPTLRPRLDAAAGNLVHAVTVLAERLAADRPALDRLADRPLGNLLGLTLGQGDPHRGGHTVSRLRFDGGSVMYKPRPAQVDAALDTFLAGLLPEAPERVRTPRTLARPGYGWAAFETHRHCADDAELAAFHRNLGHWLAVMRLLGGTDLHAANVLAVGPVPVIVDAETMFTPAPPGPAGPDATSAARRILGRAVVRTGILPARNGLVAGIDYSAVGRLPGEQPALRVRGIADAGTDEARLVQREASPSAFLNHPCADPQPERHWEEIVAGFEELSARMRRLDAAGSLAPLLDLFLGADVRLVRRSTQVYGDIRTMLTHPAAFHNEPAALERARLTLRRHARGNPSAPRDEAAIDAELAQILAGDTPVHTLTLGAAELREALEEWRCADLAREARFVTHALPGLYRDPHRVVHRAEPRPAGAEQAVRSDTPPAVRSGAPGERSAARVEQRRRGLAAASVTVLRDTAVHGADGSVSWIGPVLSAAGWGVRELGPDLFSGQAGVALCLAAYLREVRHDRAEPVDGLTELVAGAVRGLQFAESSRALPRHGALTGLPGQVWTWRTLGALLNDPAMTRRAVALARRITPDGDPLTGWAAGPAGAAVPLADLAAATADPGLRAVADGLTQTLLASADGTDDGGAADSGTADSGTAGAAGFLNGPLGTAWARARLTGGRQPDDLSGPPWSPATGDDAGWCRGAAGTALAACDLLARTGDPRYREPARAAAEAVLAAGFGHGRSLCHGDCGRWEALESARAARVGAVLPDRAVLAAALLDELEHAPTGSGAVEATAPGLMTGLAGTVLTLLRMRPDHGVPAVLLQGTVGGG
ncbi:type 2 lanthipeptide synthetase LanM family protein [Streptomyces sp. SL13]|uniref:Type 2 lanthipeptide synthetase LanM family protein n=1 Tax=Streptantibioticus silvisoli TaxID=2705255 RepID=A0AA90H600_9ACTN|nr:type 2 lanthipeptide synthetase LanM family protein [Streptantibioticus silvisoli]MDI5971057.1 type 2 lanthipeptide synthetase LanM family protein [Streptantibioticus silvisoli]